MLRDKETSKQKEYEIVLLDELVPQDHILRKTEAAADFGCIHALSVGVTAPIYLSKLFAQHFAPGGVIINISSSRDRMSQPQTESYTAAKGGIAALTHALAVSLAGRVRVNSISPGWIDMAYRVYEGPDAAQQPAGRVGHPMDIAHMALFLCSDKAASSPARTSASTAA